MGTILLVDDEQLFALTLADILEDQGFRVLTAGDGATALDLVKRHHPGLVFLDLRMPGMGGEEAARRILSQPDAPAVVVLTAAVTDEQEARLMRLGTVAVLTKPAPVSQLLDIARRMCHPPAYDVAGPQSGSLPVIAAPPGRAVG